MSSYINLYSVSVQPFNSFIHICAVLSCKQGAFKWQIMKLLAVNMCFYSLFQIYFQNSESSRLLFPYDSWNFGMYRKRRNNLFGGRYSLFMYLLFATLEEIVPHLRSLKMYWLHNITFIDTQVQAIQYILERTFVEVSIMCQLGLSQSWLHALYDTLSICDGEQQITTRKETKIMKHKTEYDKWNKLNWIESELTHDEDN